ncbi:phage terminase large subunit [Sphingomonas sp. GC_Shp_3]|uniref:phage terminase large subunit n=1 Tax=Sphingomonas sp. GC_Shp_3 TaxID=2937383 RepID=UPI002269B0CB|nr:phage terminase large subunit [Sphingomonas sp. GC_Shp_3]
MSDLSRADDPHAVIVELIRSDFVSFLISAFPHISGGADLEPNWHLDAIAHELTRVRDGSCRRLLVTLPPRNLKSIMISVAWVAWCLGRDPRLNFVCVSYSSELAAKHARDCRSIMQSGWYRELFPHTIIASTRSAVHDFETTRGGGRLATSVGGTLTGRGGDIIVIDDPIKPDDAMSDTVRDGVNEWFYATLASRLNDKKRGAIITVMQRLHQYDLAGMLLESGEWHELSLPAIATDEVTVPLTRQRSYTRLTGEALHAARHSTEELLREKRSIGSALFQAQYQQDPVPARGNMIRAEWLKSYDSVPDWGRVVQSWDTASKNGLLNDWSVCITARLVKNEVFVLNVWRRKVEFPDLRRAAISLAQHHSANIMLIEDQASGTQLYQTLLNESPRGVPQPIARKPEADKKTRLAGVSAMIEGGQLLLPTEASWLAEFKQELLAFPSGRHDDQVDALSQLLIWAGQRQRWDDQPIGGAPILFVDGEMWDGNSSASSSWSDGEYGFV